MESQSLSPVELHVVLVPLDTVQLVSPQAEVTNQPEAVSHLQDRQFSSREEESFKHQDWQRSRLKIDKVGHIKAGSLITICMINVCLSSTSLRQFSLSISISCQLDKCLSGSRPTTWSYL